MTELEKQLDLIQLCLLPFKHQTTPLRFVLFCLLRPLGPTPTYFLRAPEPSAPEGQMNSTFLPSWAVTGPHTAEARLYKWDSAGRGISRWQPRLKQPPPAPKLRLPGRLGTCGRAPTVVLWSTATVRRATLVLRGDVVTICRRWGQGFIQ